MLPTSLTIAALLPAWVLVMARVGALVLAVPVLSSSMIPRVFRAMLALAISAICLPHAMQTLPHDLTLGRAVAGIAGEIIVGILMGLSASVVFIGSQLAMQFVSQQAGLSLGEVFNPLLENESAALEQVGFFVSLVVFVSVGGSHAVVRTLLGSFDQVPPLGFLRMCSVNGGAALGEFCADMLDLTFRLSIRLAGPALISMLLSTLAMGFLVKTMPQFNVLTFGFPIKAILGVGLLAVMVTHWDGIMSDAIGESSRALDGLFAEASRELTDGR